MAKKVINTKPDVDTKKPSPRRTAELSEEIMFKPTASQAQVKARFWTRFQPGPLSDPNNLSMAMVLETTKSASVRRWWAQDGFRDWFCNREEEKERLRYLFNKGLDTMETILDNPEANANAKANIIKMLAEMNGYLNKKGGPERFADEEVNKMSEAQLKTFLERKGVKFVEEKIINVPQPVSAEAVLDKEDSE